MAGLTLKERVSEGVQIFFALLIGFVLVVLVVGGAQRLANWLILPTAHQDITYP